VLRLAAGIMILPHGLQKTFGWFGGPGFTRMMGSFTQGAHIPAAFAFLAIMAEFLGGLGLILGFLTRVAAFGVLCNMVVAIVFNNSRFGFFMNWGGRPTKLAIVRRNAASSTASDDRVRFLRKRRSNPSQTQSAARRCDL
jgi:uncharacterized membrane protein YphA (DoxX/SURF4 family)